MYYDPHTNLALARARHDDLLREAHRRQLAAQAMGPRPSLRERVAALVGRRVETRRPVPAAS